MIHIDLLEYKQTVRLAGDERTYRVLRYPGTTGPKLVREDANVAVMTQSGTATAFGRKFKAPTPIFDTLLESPVIQHQDLGENKWETYWSYSMVKPTDVVFADELAAWQAWPEDLTDDDFLPLEAA